MGKQERDGFLRVIERLQTANAKLTSALKKQSDEIAALRAELSRLTALLSAARGNAADAPSVPSGQIPPFKKSSVPKKAAKRGRKGGHIGTTRARPETWDNEKSHTTSCCPHCDSKVKPLTDASGCQTLRFRFTEDVVFGESQTTRHEIGQYWCRSCERKVEPVVVDALPGDRLGIQLLCLTALQHYLHGVTVSKIVELLHQQHGIKVTGGALVKGWQRLAALLSVDYEKLVKEIRQAGALHADETGWRVNGSRHWLWCFCTKREVVYFIDKSRSSSVVIEVLGEEFGGVKIHDFYGAYNALWSEETQYCIAHLLREFKKVRAKDPEGLTDEFLSFERRIKRLVRDAIHFAAGNHDPPARRAARQRFEKRLLKITDPTYEHPDAERLAKRLSKTYLDIFTFVTAPGVDPTNNWAETNIRPAVIIRKNSYGNASRAGADTQAVLMSLLRTMKLRGQDPLDELVTMVKGHIRANHAAKYR